MSTVTFLKLSIESVDVTWLAGLSAIQISLSQGLSVDNNNVPGKQHQSVTSIQAPQVVCRILLTSETARPSWLEAAEISFDVYLDIYSAPKGWKERGIKQSEFIREQDKPTGRAKRMMEAANSSTNLSTCSIHSCPCANIAADFHQHQTGLYLPQPRLSFPKKAAPPPNAAQTILQPTPTRPWHSSRTAQLSESENEDNISEAARDARLA